MLPVETSGIEANGIFIDIFEDAGSDETLELLNRLSRPGIAENSAANDISITS